MCPSAEFRKACRDYAAEWIDVQRAEFRRMGVAGEWDKSLHHHGVRRRSCHRLRIPEIRGCGAGLSRFLAGDVVAGGEDRALAEAEVEYHDKVSARDLGEIPGTRCEGGWVGRVPRHGWRKCGDLDHHALDDPGQNRAICYSKKISYGLYEVVGADTGADFLPWARPGGQADRG